MKCPICESEKVEITGGDSPTYMCLQCGFTTNSLMIPESEYLEKILLSASILVVDCAFDDVELNLVWIPQILNMGEKGMIYPIGNHKDNWHWEYAQVVDIPEDKREKYPVPNKEGQFYKSKLDIENAKKYKWNDFYTACKDMGLYG